MGNTFDIRLDKCQEGTSAVAFFLVLFTPLAIPRLMLSAQRTQSVVVLRGTCFVCASFFVRMI